MFLECIMLLEVAAYDNLKSCNLDKTAIKWSDFLPHPLCCFLLVFSGMFYVVLVTFLQDLNILTIPDVFVLKCVVINVWWFQR